MCIHYASNSPLDTCILRISKISTLDCDMVDVSVVTSVGWITGLPV